MVADINPGAGSGSPARLAAVSGRLWFSANDGVAGVEPWMSDGTAVGTRRVGDLAQGAANSYPLSFTALGTRVLFVADDGSGNERLWVRSDSGEVTRIGSPLQSRLRR